MNVTIFYRNSMDGGDGWTYYPMHVTIGDFCPVCFAKRATPVNYTFCEDGEWFNVDRWENPCGHIDKYADCLKEARRIAASDKMPLTENFKP